MSSTEQAPPLAIANEKRLAKISKCINLLCEGFRNAARPSDTSNGKANIFHYTPFSKLFDLLEGDSFWASRSRFSNDSTEDRLFDDESTKKQQYYGDNYIVCFCDKDDLLSQWRCYCPQGGASIELHIGSRHTYTLFHSEYNGGDTLDGNKTISYSNRPLRVIYSRPKQHKQFAAQCKGAEIEDVVKGLRETLQQVNSEDTGETEPVKINETDIVPFLKNGFFFEERERRLVFDNSNGDIEKCVRFRKLADGARVPYIVVKYGNLLDSGQMLKHTYTSSRINELFETQKEERKGAITIPCGNDQEKVCREFSKKLVDYKRVLYEEDGSDRARKRLDGIPIRIICDGHLPIVSITVSPSPQQTYMKEVIERFCRSRYWLQNVEVKCSPIPYIAPGI